jgi:3-hydroxybutyryl-CoA dehydrogenase
LRRRARFNKTLFAIETIAVIGAGRLGRGIARDALRGGYKTILEDISRERLEAAADWIRDHETESGAETAKVRALGAQECSTLRKESGRSNLGSIITTSKLEEAIREADLIIETVPEEMEMKIELFTIFDKFAKPNAILASATPALSVAEMSAVTFCRERCIGIEFFHVGSETNRVELVVTLDTSESAVAACREVASRMGKEAVLVRETDSGDRSGSKAKSTVG